jgi:hypothetical protein
MKLDMRMITSASVATWATLLSSLSGGTTETTFRDSQLAQRMTSLNQAVRVSTLTGMNVRNLQGEKLGVVENLLVDLPTGRLVAVVMTSGGFLGMGKVLSAIPPMAMRFSEGRDFLQLDVTKEWLSNAPHFSAQQWPDFAQPEVTLGLYKAYGIDLDSSWFEKAEVMNNGEGQRNTGSDVTTTTSIHDILAMDKNAEKSPQHGNTDRKDGETNPSEEVDYDDKLQQIRTDAADPDADHWVVDPSENPHRP